MTKKVKSKKVKVRKVTNCCGASPIFPESDICSKCGEHAEILTEKN